MTSISFPPSLSEPAADLAQRVIERLRGAGHQALLVGGCVRDLLLGRTPEDWDVATSALPDVVMALLPRTIPVGAKFGVVLAVDGEAQVEVATFRRESGYSDRRRPDHIEYSTADEDARRRDFTVNGLYFDPSSGEIIDYVGGQGDLAARTLRAIGEPRHRFAEDALRLLRALRFASSLDFEIEPATWDALRELAPTIREISMERIRDELVKGLTRAHPERFLQLLDDSGMIEIILPEIAAMKGCEQPPEYHPEGDVFVHTKIMLSLLPANPSPALALAVLLHDVGKPPTAKFERGRIRFNNHDKLGAEMADAICRRLMFSNDERERIVAMVARHMNYINLPNMRASTLRRFLCHDDIHDELELHRADCLSSHGALDNYDFAKQKLSEFAEQASAPPKLPPPLITGNDLIAAGLKPGPEFKTLLTTIQDAQLEGTIATREQGLEMLRTLL